MTINVNVSDVNDKLVYTIVLNTARLRESA